MKLYQGDEKSAEHYLQEAIDMLQERAKEYDAQDNGGERSIPATVEAFKTITGDGLMNTAERGWLFMELLKMVRTQQGAWKEDSYIDGISYASLRAEAANQEKK